MRSALSYFPGRSPLHRANPGPAISFLGSLVFVAFVFASPLMLLSAGLAIAAVGLLAGAGRTLRASLRFALPLLAVMVAINALVSNRGDTVLVRGWELPVLGNTDVTLESLVDGGRVGLLVVVAVLAFAVYSACVDPDRMIRALRPLARRSAMTTAVIARLVPLAAADGARLTEASALRGPAAAPVGRALIARRLLESSLDRSVDVAATLELRGYSLPGAARPRRERSREDGPLWLAAALILAAAAAALLAGAGGFETYPRVELAADLQTLALCLSLPVLALVPFALRSARRRRRAPVGPGVIPEGRHA
jgi:energy-coupling factor transport system permease protein